MVCKSFYDSIARIRNSMNVGLRQVYLRFSSLTFNVLQILYELGFISGFKLVSRNMFSEILVFLRFFGNISVLRGLLLLSKPSRFSYVSYKQLSSYFFYKQNFNSFFIITTHKGLFTDRQCISLRLGGKLLLEVF